MTEIDYVELIAELNRAVVTLEGIMEQLRWRPMKDAPRDCSKIVAWHWRWKCQVTISYNPNISEKEDFPWIDGQRTACWPEESFKVWRPEILLPDEDINGATS